MKPKKGVIYKLNGFFLKLKESKPVVSTFYVLSKKGTKIKNGYNVKGKRSFRTAIVRNSSLKNAKIVKL